MGFIEILTIVFIILKVLGLIDWSWWLVFLPEIIMAVIYVLLIIANVRMHKKAIKRFDDMWNKF